MPAFKFQIVFILFIISLSCYFLFKECYTHCEQKWLKCRRAPTVVFAALSELDPRLPYCRTQDAFDLGLDFLDSSDLWWGGEDLLIEWQTELGWRGRGGA